MRRACTLALTVAVGAGSALADETPIARPASPGSTPPAKSRQIRRHPPKPAQLSTVRLPAAADIVGGAAASTPVSVAPVKGEGAWSIDPRWNASSGATAASYGTRGLLDELKHTPGESSGYGGGATLNLHF